MLDLKFLCVNFNEVKEKFKFCGEDLMDLGCFEDLDVKCCELIV